MPKKRPKGFRHVANPKVMNAVYLLLRASVILVMVAQFFNRNYENVFLCILTLILFLLPSLIERKLQVDLPDTLEIIILLFAYSAEILGEIQAFYIIFPYWDTILHTLNGFLCAAIGFSLVDLLNRSFCSTCRRTRCSTPSPPSCWTPTTVRWPSRCRTLPM